MNIRNELINIIEKHVHHYRDYLKESDSEGFVRITDYNEIVCIAIDVEKFFGFDFDPVDINYETFHNLNSLCEYVKNKITATAEV